MKSASASGIEYSLIRSRRKTADIVIERDGRVVVRAPETVPAEQIADIVDAKQFWIYRSLAEWRDLNATRVLREFRDGEGFLYLGRAYRLRLVSGQRKPLSLRRRPPWPPTICTSRPKPSLSTRSSPNSAASPTI